MRTKVRIRENALLARLAARRLRVARVAMVVGHTIYLHGVSRADFLKSERWVCHELQHVAQYERYGLSGFLIRYIRESIRRGYYANYFEAEARAAERDHSLLDRYEVI